MTGHNEVILVVFSPQVVSYPKLLKVFWEIRDPTQGMRQGKVALFLSAKAPKIIPTERIMVYNNNCQHQGIKWRGDTSFIFFA